MVLRSYTRDIGKQNTYLLAKLSYTAPVVLNHLLRNSSPHITLALAQHAVESQTSLLRELANASEVELPNRQFTMATTPHPINCAVESTHLGYSNGGIGWTNAVSVRKVAYASMRLDTLPILREIPQINAHIPRPSEWATASDPSLRYAINTILAIFNLPSFSEGPPRNAECWAKVRARLTNSDGRYL
jgi:hypothetical protein